MLRLRLACARLGSATMASWGIDIPCGLAPAYRGALTIGGMRMRQASILVVVLLMACDGAPPRTPGGSSGTTSATSAPSETTSSTAATTTTATSTATSTSTATASGVQSEGSSSASSASGAPSASCPGTVPAAGAACSQGGQVCGFGATQSCRCTESNCASPTGHTNPNCKPTLGWVCRTDGCPWDMSGTCKKPGQKCSQDDGLCAFDYECQGGKWKQTGGPGCRP